jgi:hypothetical protein
VAETTTALILEPKLHSHSQPFFIRTLWRYCSKWIDSDIVNSCSLAVNCQQESEPSPGSKNCWRGSHQLDVQRKNMMKVPHGPFLTVSRQVKVQLVTEDVTSTLKAVQKQTFTYLKEPSLKLQFVQQLDIA